MYILHACRRNRNLALGDAACVRSSRRRVSLRGACTAFCGAGVAEVLDPELYSTYWEVRCYFFICGESKGRGRGGVAFSTWAEYLFPGVGEDQIQELTVLFEPKARQLASQSKVTLKESVAGSSSRAPSRNFCY